MFAVIVVPVIAAGVDPPITLLFTVPPDKAIPKVLCQPKPPEPSVRARTAPEEPTAEGHVIV